MKQKIEVEADRRTNDSSKIARGLAEGENKTMYLAQVYLPVRCKPRLMPTWEPILSTLAKGQKVIQAS
jgi:hypothetical protein